MQPTETERRAAETILERGVRVPIPAPRFLRMIGMKKINLIIHQPTLRTMFTAAELALSEGFSIDDIADGNTDAALQMVVKHARSVCRIVAFHVLNGKRSNQLFSKMLGNWLFSRLTNQLLLDIALIIVLLSRYQDFTSTIRLFKTMTMTMTMPKNLSPEEKGSQKAKQ